MPNETRQVTTAVYRHGLLEPLGRLDLDEEERVQVVVERLAPPPPADREAKVARLRAGIESMTFRSTGRYPSRDELHDRA